MTSEPKAVDQPPRLNIAVLHLDLGIGGAEQLIVNVAKQLQVSGHSVHLFTTHHDVNHCFDETKPDGVLGDRIHVYGDFLPRHIARRFTALCATIRMLFLTICFLWLHHIRTPRRTAKASTASSAERKSYYDVVIIDGVSTPLPLLKHAGCKILFYCHFPDQLLCTEGRESALKAAYRYVLDALEEHTTLMADTVVVNSHFTASICRDTWPSLAQSSKPLEVLYPVVEIPSVPSLPEGQTQHARPFYAPYSVYDTVFVSLNRYERKKNIGVALEALAIVHQSDADPVTDENPSPQASRRRVLLVIAGGYDERVDENCEYLKELQQLCQRLKLTFRYETDAFQLSQESTDNSSDDANDSKQLAVDVVFRTSISSAERQSLFLSATALLYTPDREHFGIVPLEAMGVGLPVIAMASGGPLESVRHNRSGFLCTEQTGAAFARFMVHFIGDTRSQDAADGDGDDAGASGEDWQAYDPKEAEDYAVVQSKPEIERVTEAEAFRPRRQLAAYAKQHVQKRFSAEVMRNELNEFVVATAAGGTGR